MPLTLNPVSGKFDFFTPDMFPKATGSDASPYEVSAAAGISLGTANFQVHFIKGAGGSAADISIDPQISGIGTFGRFYLSIGQEDSAAVIIESGTSVDINGPWAGGENDALLLFDTGATVIEISRF